MPDRLVGIGRTGVSRTVEVGRDPDVDPRADRAVGVAVLEAGEVPQLVRGDRDRQRDEVGARRRGLAGLPSRLLTLTEAVSAGVTWRPAAVSVVVPVMSRSRQSIDGRDATLQAGQRRVVEVDRGIRARRWRRLGERVRERRIVGGQLRLDRVALGLWCRRARRGSVRVSKSSRTVRVMSPSSTSLPPRPAIRSWPPPPIERVVARVADDRVVVRAAQHVGDPHRVGKRQGQACPGSRSAGRSGSGRSRSPPARRRSRASRRCVPAGSTTVWLPLEPPLKANVSLPPPPTSESLPAPPTSVSSPVEPISVSSPVPARSSVLPEKPEASSVKSPGPAARIACWNPLIVEVAADAPPPEVESVVLVSVMFIEP